MSDSYALFGAPTRIESKRKTKNSTHQARKSTFAKYSGMTLMGLIIAQQLSGTPDTPSLATAEHKMSSSIGVGRAWR